MSADVGRHVVEPGLPHSLAPACAPTVLDLFRQVDGWGDLADGLPGLPQIKTIQTWGARLGEHDGWASSGDALGAVHRMDVLSLDGRQ